MANAAIVTFWGSPIPGREQKALQLFKEGTQFWVDKKDKGEIESIDAVEFDHFSADLRGLMIIRGDRDKVTKLVRSDEVVSLGYQLELPRFGRQVRACGRGNAPVLLFIPNRAFIVQR